MKLALDTNILAYAEGVKGVAKRDFALDFLRTLPREALVIPVQVLGELYNVLIRKAGRSRSAAREAVAERSDTFVSLETSRDGMVGAIDLAMDRQLGIWDAVILAAASRAGCRLLLSEDMQEGFTWGGVTVVNPFSSTRHPLLGALLEPRAP